MSQPEDIFSNVVGNPLLADVIEHNIQNMFRLRPPVCDV